MADSVEDALLPYADFAQEYRKNSVNGASPVQLVIMLYDGAVRFMEAGKAAMLNGELDKQNFNLQRAQKIVMELMVSLDMQRGGEIAKNLLGLYSFVLEQLVSANMEDRPQGVDFAIKTLSELRESWAKIEEASRTPKVEEIEHAA